MSATWDTLRAIRRWEREHERRPDVVYVCEALFERMAREAIPQLTPEQIRELLTRWRLGEDVGAVGGYSLARDETLGVDEIRPEVLSRSIYTGVPGGRLVGPEDEAFAMQAALNDPELQVAFDPELVDEHGAHMLTRRAMAGLGVNHPVLVLPGKHRDKWLADRSGVLKVEYTGPLPARPDAARKTWSLTSPKPA